MYIYIYTGNLVLIQIIFLRIHNESKLSSEYPKGLLTL